MKKSRKNRKIENAIQARVKEEMKKLRAKTPLPNKDASEAAIDEEVRSEEEKTAIALEKWNQLTKEILAAD